MFRQPANTIQLASLLAAVVLAGCNSAGQSFAGPSDSQGRGDTSAVLGAVAGDGQCTVSANANDLALQVLSLVNIERARVGVDPLTLNDELTVVAGDYGCTMASQGFFAHVNPNTGEGPGDRAEAAGYSYFAVGENLAAGQSTPAEAVEGWLASTGHRHNLLSPEWRETGIAVRHGGSYGAYWVQMFGKPATIAHPAVIGDGALTVSRP